jgi:hypothetical protein
VFFLQQLANEKDYFYRDLRDTAGRVQCLFIAPKSAVALYRTASEVLVADCTYKTNRFNLPLLNFCGIQAFRKSFSIACAFINAEAEGQYRWALNALKEFLASESLPLPRVIITDRELALINAFKRDEAFMAIPRLLCRWHVNMNVLAKCKRFFGPATRLPGGKVKRNERFTDFLQDWNHLLTSTTEAVFEERLGSMRRRGKYPEGAVNYAVNTWITPYKKMLVDCWANKIMHFGNRTSSIVESLHAGIKRFIRSAGGDLASVFRKLKQYWRNQSADIALVRAQGMNKVPYGLEEILFGDVKTAVVVQALRACVKEIEAIPKQPRPDRWDLGPPEPCACSITASHGLPCRHVLFVALRDHEPLTIAQFDPYWRWDRLAPAQPASRAGLPLDPALIRGKGRPRGALSTKRLPSAHENTEVEEAREALPPPSTAPPKLQKRPAPPTDTYEPGTALPRRSAQLLARLESVADEGDEFDLIPVEFEGRFDEKASQLEQETLEAQEAAREYMQS